MTKFKYFMAAMCAVLCMSTALNASILGGALTYDGVEDLIVDESRAGYIDDGDGSIGADDIIFGVVQITSIQSSGVPTDFIPPPTVGAIFSATVISGDGSAGSPFLLGPTAQTGAGGFGLDALAPNLYAASGATAAQKAASIFLVGSHAGNLNLIVDSGVSAKANVIAAETLLTTGGMYEATVGLAAVNPYGDADFFSATIAGAFLVELGGFTVFDDVIPADLLGVSPDGVVTEHDVALSGLISAAASGSVYTFADDAEFKINVTPEPTSVAVWGLITCFVIGRRSRRN